MSNKTQLQTNNTSLEECITRINAAKEVAAGLPEAGGGSSGGNDFEGNTDTCTIMIDSYYTISGIGYYNATNGYNVIACDDSTYTINAACGSVIYIAQAGYYRATVNTGEILYEGSGNGLVYRVPSTPTIANILITTD